MERLISALLFAALVVGCARGGGGGELDAGRSNRPDLGAGPDGAATDAAGAHDGAALDGSATDGATPPDGDTTGDGAVLPDGSTPPLDAGDPCAACDPAAACDTRMGVRCICPSGYTDVHGDGSLCTPPSACATATCDPHATCATAPGTPGYTCTCAMGWMGSGATCTDVDECASGTAGCSSSATCANVPGSYTCTCLTGYSGDGHTCTDVNECTSGTATCSPSASCANTPGSYTCTCNPGFSGDGHTCTMATTNHVLVYDDTSTTLAGAAAITLGMMPNVTNATTFDAAFDAGGFTILVVDSGFNYLGADVQMRIGTWLAGGGRCLFAYWSLDSVPALASQLGVTLGGSFTSVRNVYADPASPAPFFASVRSPLTPMDTLADDGDVVTPISGATAARFDSTGGPSAIAITAANKVVVNGFSPYEANMVDNDGDGIFDSQEIWAAELTWVAAH